MNDALASAGTPRYWLAVALDVPLADSFDYYHDLPVEVGVRVRVRFGHRELIGVVVGQPTQPQFEVDQVKPIEAVLDDTPPLSNELLELARFAARYYQRFLGEVLLPALPMPLRKPSAYTSPKANGGPVARLRTRKAKAPPPYEPDQRPTLNAQQQAAVAAILSWPRPNLEHTISRAPAPAPSGQTGCVVVPQPAPSAAASSTALPQLNLRASGTHLLFGVTGSGKTEVYLHAALQVLGQGQQVLFMVPEINLTPQFEQALRQRLQTATQSYSVAVMHSGLSATERLRAWLAVSQGEADVLLGTRLSIFTPMPRLGLIIVDEEHDSSYKQQEGLRYSARDLAVWRGHQLACPVVLGSATPSLESWAHAQRGQYQLSQLTERARAVSLPDIQLIDIRRAPLEQGFSQQYLRAIHEQLAQRKQVLVFINRRGYAPVLNCASCGWVSQCRRCSAYTVLHRQPGSTKPYLQCHHCGFQAVVPRHCPDCRNQDLKPMGRGTQRIEEYLSTAFPAARVLRIDADSTRKKGSAEALFAQVHAGEIDILVGTQMVAKGHDFANLGLVLVLNADATLFAQDFRAPERLFAQLMQVAGRAGRHIGGAKVYIQTEYPEQGVYQHLLRHDYVGFANHLLAEREALALPPYSYQALLTAEAKELSTALSFLNAARTLLSTDANLRPWAQAVQIYDPVPLRIVRVANIERAQLLVESPQRQALQRFLLPWRMQLHTLARQHRIRWVLEVDPLEI